MKNKFILVSVLLSQSIFASEIMYPDIVKNLYASHDSKKAIGRLLPTSEVKVLAKEDGRIKVELSGYVQENKEQAVYFNEGSRILVAAFKKSDIPKYNVISKGSWSKVSFEAYTDSDGMQKELEPMMKRAETLYAENCSMCHALHDIQEYNANQWPSVFKSMVDRTAIEKKDRFLVTEYLQKTTTKK